MTLTQITATIRERLLKEPDIKLVGSRGRRGDAILASHSEGLPGDYNLVEVKMNYKPSEGDWMVVITPTHVHQYMVPYPCNYNNWRSAKAVGYSTPDQMVANVRELMNPDVGAWGAPKAKPQTSTKA